MGVERNAGSLGSVVPALGAFVLAAVAAFGGEQAEVGKPAPELLVSALEGERTLTLDDFKGRVAVLEFWATTCGVCQGQIPHLSALRARYDERELALLAITADSVELLREFLPSSGVTYAIGRDADLRMHGRWGVPSYPRIFVVDPGGTVLFAGSPGDAGFDAAVESAVRRHAAGLPFGRRYASLAERRDSGDTVLLEVRSTVLGARSAALDARSAAGPQGPARTLRIDVAGGHFSLEGGEGPARRSDFPLADEERAELFRALWGADFALAPRSVGSIKPGALTVEITVTLAADAVRSVVFCPDPAGFVDPAVRLPAPLVALWGQLEPLLQRGATKAR